MSEKIEYVTWDERTSYTARGLARYEIVIRHLKLNKVRVIKAPVRSDAIQQATAQIKSWDAQWQKQEHENRNRCEAEQRTEKAQAILKQLQGVLTASLQKRYRFGWGELKTPFEEPEPVSPKPLKLPNKPEKPIVGPEPSLSNPEYQPELSLLDVFNMRRRREKQAAARKRFEGDHREWKRELARQRRYPKLLEQYKEKKKAIVQRNQEAQEKHYAAMQEWKKRKSEHEEREGARVKAFQKAVEKREAQAVEKYFKLVLDQSEYPDVIPREFEVGYNATSGVLVVDFTLPAPTQIPTLKEVSYVRTRGAFSEKRISKKDADALYDSVVYQLCLRVVHEIFSLDSRKAVDTVVFNGYVRDIDPRTGKEVTTCIVSLQAEKEEFQELDLSLVDPKACFKALKGVGSSKLHGLAPVAPILRLSKEDSRFIPARDVAADVDERTNLAAIDWKDFEHLIRELFEAEFSEAGAEVKVTQASRDRGVDAIVFDTRPIYGGKLILQAKRYTNTVGVDAVRDLYGTVINEGASKGILITTSDFGPEAHKFAVDKPIELLNGGNLLHLLEKHGHRAKIDLREAKRILAEEAAG
jgi:restriction system protein